MVQVEEGEVAIIESLNDSRASARRGLIPGGREPGGIVGIEVPHDDGRVLGVKQEGEVGSEMGGAR